MLWVRTRNMRSFEHHLVPYIYPKMQPSMRSKTCVVASCALACFFLAS